MLSAGRVAGLVCLAIMARTGTPAAEDDGKRLYLVAPSQALEGANTLAEKGRVFLRDVTTNEVSITLSSDSPVQVPPVVKIPAGRSSAEFPISVANDNFYSANFHAEIRAYTDGYPDATTTVVITDNDSSRMRVVVPPIIWEGESMQGMIVLDAPRRLPLEVTLQLSPPASITMPNKVIVPAGATSAPFPLGFVAEFNSAGLTAKASDGAEAADSFQAHKNDPIPTTLYFENDTRAPFVGDAIQLKARLAGKFYTANTNAVGELRLLDPLGLTAFAPQTIQFTNGQWNGTVVINKAAPDLQFEVTAAGLTASSGVFDVTDGAILNKRAIAAEWNHATGLFYVSEGPVTNTTGKLFAFSPTNATSIANSLDLPLPATHLTVSDDGSTAWLVLTNRKFLRVNLNNWTFGDALNPSTNAFELVRDIALLRNETDKFVAVIGPYYSGPSRIQLFTNGVPTGAVVKFSSSIFDEIQLIAGADATEMFCQGRDLFYRLVVDSLGVRVQKQIQFSSWGPRPFTYAQGRLYSRAGLVLDAQTLDIVLKYDLERSSMAVLPFPEINRVFQIYPGGVSTFNAATGEILSDVAARPSGFTLAWDDGMAVFNATNIFVTPLPMMSGNADLALKFIGPTVYTNNAPDSFSDLRWEFEVENLGPDAASYAHLWTKWGEYRVGALKAGERRRFFASVNLVPSGIIEQQVRLTSPTDDPNPSNNTAHAVTWVRSNIKMFDGHVLNVAATALVGLPNLERVYVAYSTRLGSDAPGIAVIDTTTGEIVRSIDTETNVSRLAISADAQFLFGIESTNLVRRWRVDTGALEHTWQFEGTAVLDIAAAPIASDAVVIATAFRVGVYRDDTELAGKFEEIAAKRAMVAAGDALLVLDDPGFASSENALHKFRMTDAGLIDHTGPFTVPGPNSRFTYAAPWVMGDLFAFNPISNEQKEMYGAAGLDFSDKGVVVTVQDNKAIIRDSTLRALHEEMLPSFWSYNATRFGDRGVAVTGAYSQLILTRLASLPIIDAPADLEVSIKPPQPFYSLVPGVLEFAVTNRSTATAVNTHLVIEPDRSFSATELTVADAMMVNGSATVALGDIPGGGIKTVSAVLQTYWSGVRLVARAFSNSRDPEPTNNVAEFGAYPPWPPAVFELNVATTNRATVGQQVPVTITVRNAGELALPNVRMYVNLYTQGASLIGLPPDDFALQPGETRIFNGRVAITGSGLIGLQVMLSPDNFISSGTTSSGQLIYVPPQGQAPSSIAMPNPQIFAWNEPRQEIVAAFQGPAIIAGLDPKTFEPRWTVPRFAAQLLPTSDGKYLWATGGQGALRINIAEAKIDREFAVDPAMTEFRAMASPPGQPDVLVVSYMDGAAGKTKAFRDGVALPGELTEFGWLTMSAEGRLFFASYRESGLKELALTETGLSMLKEFATGFVPEPITAFEGKVYYLSGRVFDLTTEQMQTPQPLAVWTAVDPTTRRIYHLNSAPNGVVLDAQQIGAQPDWRIFLDRETLRMPIGTNGVLLSERYGSDARVMTFEEASQVDLNVESSLPQIISGPGTIMNVGFMVRDSRAAPAKNVRLSIDLPAGISVQDSSRVFIPTTHLEMTFAELDYYGAGTNLIMRFDTSAPGEIVARVTSDGPEADPTNNEARFGFEVAPLPVVLMDDLTFSESGVATIWLSAPAPRELLVRGLMQPITGDTTDIAFGEPTFYFAPGATKANAFVVNNDRLPELAETFRLTLQPSELSMVRTQAVLTVLDDDYPTIRGSTNSVKEGDSGMSTISVTIWRDLAPFPSEVDYETVSDTAIASRDFEPASGRLQFAAGETFKKIQLQVMGNTEFAPSKRFSIALKNPVDATIAGNVVVIISNDDPPPGFSVTITQLATGRYRVTFPALPNVGYALQYKRDLKTAQWAYLYDGTTTFNGPIGQFEYWPEIPRTTFLRVIAVPH